MSKALIKRFSIKGEITEGKSSKIKGWNYITLYFYFTFQLYFSFILSPLSKSNPGFGSKICDPLYEFHREKGP